MNIAKILRTPFLQNISGGYFCKFLLYMCIYTHGEQPSVYFISLTLLQEITKAAINGNWLFPIEKNNYFYTNWLKERSLTRFKTVSKAHLQ